ncbi:MAG: bifunctional folylpolyglutamate synthase/dihydrofolate synthase [Deltaproteobacteria bacterium]|nr:bifunctional folylpolyglutamate synthase/dihydrofolate synthase [Deltaproteobacteria bacterium]
MPSSNKTLDYLYGLEKRGIRLGLRRIKALLSLLGNPHKAYPSVIVAGTNGKGSTCAMIEAMLLKGGYRTGLYTSPHLIRFNERIRVAGKEITNRDIARITEKIRTALKRSAVKTPPTFFEFATAIAFEYFCEKKVDIAVLETGMGGRLDAANAAPACVSVITNIALEHTEYLGDTIEEIAKEKAGIIKKGGAVVTSARGKATAVIRRTAGEKGSELFVMGRDFDIRQRKGGFDYEGDEKIKQLGTNLIGAHQMINAGLALKVAELLSKKGFPMSQKAIRQGLKVVIWPCRFEVVSRHPFVVLDAAHNPEGAATLADTFKGFGSKRLVIVLGIMADKDIGGIMSKLAPPAHTLIITRPENERAAKTEALCNIAMPYGKRVIIREGVRSALKQALLECGQKGIVCVTGSIYTVGEAKRFFGRPAK